MAAWFGGTKERNPDVAIWGSRRVGDKWGKPVELEREVGVPSWNPVLFHTADGRLWLYYKVGGSPGTWWGGRRWSDDEGMTWSAKERLPEGILGPIRAKPLVLPDGTVVSGSSVESGTWNSWVERSVDGGKTFTKYGPITVPKEVDAKETPAPEPAAGSVSLEKGSDAKPGPRKYEGIIQPSVIDLGAGHLRLYARGADAGDEGGCGGLEWTRGRLGRRLDTFRCRTTTRGWMWCG